MAVKTASQMVPAYGMIPLFGGGASVTFKVQKRGDGSTSASHTGYDIQGLLEQYVGSGIPVIDMRTAEHYRSPRLSCRETSILGEFEIGSSLEEHVEHYRSLGATIYYLRTSEDLQGILEAV